jgi:hypothetical protein
VPVWLGDDVIMEDSPGIHACGSVAGWGFPTQSLLCPDTCVDIHVKCPLLLSDSNQNWNVSTNFRETPNQIYLLAHV